MIHVKKLKKTFEKISVLKDLDLKILPGQRVALVGQNGSGKTTLIRCLLGLYQFEGDIEVFGVNISKKREEALKKIAFVPQLPPALKNTVAEMLSLTSQLCDFSEKKVWLIAMELGLDLQRCLHTPFKGLSGGMKQKLLIALALAREPEVLIMDEPSANLDPASRSVFFKLLASLPPETTMLLTSHRVDELSGIVTRVIELDQGYITIDDIVESKDKDILTQKQECLIALKKVPDSIKSVLIQWSFKSEDPEELNWKGVVSSADSFRFHATLTRWSGVIESMSLRKIEEKEKV
jgi:ABC-2 type transport system ATP-binding protein